VTILLDTPLLKVAQKNQSEFQIIATAGWTPNEARPSFSPEPMTSARAAQKVLAKQMHRMISKRILAAGTPPYGTIYRSYYYAGTSRVAVRVQESDGGNEVYYLLSDHLGSSSVSYRASNGSTQMQYYKPWGEIRPTTSGNILPTDYTYTGQRSYRYIKLSWYGSRWYDLARIMHPGNQGFLVDHPFTQTFQFSTPMGVVLGCNPSSLNHGVTQVPAA